MIHGDHYVINRNLKHQVDTTEKEDDVKRSSPVEDKCHQQYQCIDDGEANDDVIKDRNDITHNIDQVMPHQAVGDKVCQ